MSPARVSIAGMKSASHGLGLMGSLRGADESMTAMMRWKSGSPPIDRTASRSRRT
jgi:hypothetical protein